MFIAKYGQVYRFMHVNLPMLGSSNALMSVRLSPRPFFFM